MNMDLFVNKRKLLNIVCLLVLITSVANAQFVKLHDFTDNPDGSCPEGSLFYDGTFLYGTTYYGGTSNAGIIFKLKPDGTEYSKLFDFSSVNGGHPSLDSLISDGIFLYGMTSSGGVNMYDGVIFKIKPDGSEYVKLWDFENISGSGPAGSLMFSGTYLYGMTLNGGSNNNGVLFRIKPDGSEYSKLLDFPDTINGRRPFNSLISNGTFLYGMTYYGGTADIGTVFKFHPLGIGIPEKNSEIFFSVYPNPCKTTVYLEGIDKYTGEIFLFDAIGKLVSTTLQYQNRKTAIDV